LHLTSSSSVFSAHGEREINTETHIHTHTHTHTYRAMRVSGLEFLCCLKSFSAMS
jgi:hypothetical protein